MTRTQIIPDTLKTEVILVFMDSFMNYDSFVSHRFNPVTSYHWTKTKCLLCPPLQF